MGVRLRLDVQLDVNTGALVDIGQWKISAATVANWEEGVRLHTGHSFAQLLTSEHIEDVRARPAVALVLAEPSGPPRPPNRCVAGVPTARNDDGTGGYDLEGMADDFERAAE